MAKTVEELVIEMSLNNKQVLKSMDKFNKKLKKNDNAVKKSAKKREGFLKKMKKNWLGLTASIGTVAFGLKKMFDATRRQEKAEQQLNAVIKSTGGVAGLTAEEIKNMASSLQAVTTFGDEAIIEGQNILLTFKKIGEDVFPRATESMLDVATAMGQDMKTTAVQLGKALNDPIEGLTALRRVGITFSAEQENTIRTMAKTNQVADAQKIILEELESQFGGSAKAVADGLGAWTRFGNIIGDLVERVGAFVFKGISPLIDGIISLTMTETELTKKNFDLGKSQLKQARNTSSLVAEYKDLEGKTKRTKEENERFRVVADKISKLLPDAVTGVDKLTGAYIINSEQAENSARANEKYAELLVKTEVTNAISNINDLNKANKNLEEKVKKLAPALNKLTEEYIRLGPEQAKSNAINTQYTSGVKSTADRLNDVKAQITDYTKSIKENDSAIQRNRGILEEGRKLNVDLGEDMNKQIDLQIKLTKEREKATKRAVELAEKQKASTEEINKIIENNKNLWSEYYTFINDERSLDLLNEKESYEQSQQALKDLLKANLITREEYNNNMELLQFQHDLNLIEMEKSKRGKIDELNKLARAKYKTDYTLLEKDQREHINNQLAEEERATAQRKEFAQQYQTAMGTAIGNVTSAYADGITEMIFSGETWRKSFVDFVSDMLLALSKLIVKMLIVKGIQMALGGVGLFPGFAKGTDSAPGGLAVVGEKGPELVNLPKGSQVIPNHRISNMSSFATLPHYANGIGGDEITNNEGNSVVIENLSIDTPDANDFIDQLSDLSDNVNSRIFRR